MQLFFHPQVSSCVSSRMCHAVEASCTNHCHTTQRVTPLGGREQGSGPAGPVEPSTDCYSLTWVGWQCHGGCLFFFFFFRKVDGEVEKKGSAGLQNHSWWAHFSCTKPQFIFTWKLVLHENAEHDATFMPCLSPFLFLFTQPEASTKASVNTKKLTF